MEQSEFYAKKGKLAKMIEELITVNNFTFDEIKMLSSILYSKVKAYQESKEKK